MVHVEIKDLYKKKYSLLWCILSFKAGLLNAAGFLIAGSYVSHITGFGTQVGVAIGHSEYDLSLELFIIPTSFLLGAYLASMVLDRDYSEHRVPNYPLVQLLITGLLGGILLLFSLGLLSGASQLPKSTGSVLLIGLLCLVCGLKNGLTTWATHGKIRTTHLTGLITDIGLHLPKLFGPEGVRSRYPESKNVSRVRILTVLSFSMGSCLSALLIPEVGYKVFYFAFGISLVLSVVSIVHRRMVIESLGGLRSEVMYADSEMKESIR